MGEQIVDLYYEHIKRSDRNEARELLLQIWRGVRAERKRRQDEERNMRARFSDQVSSEGFEKLLLLDKLCLEEEQTRQGKGAGDGE